MKTETGTEAPKIWRDMTPEEKGALLLANHEGKVIELWSGNRWWRSKSTVWHDVTAYRIKPEPKRETVDCYMHYADKCVREGYNINAKNIILISIALIDGEPDKTIAPVSW